MRLLLGVLVLVGCALALKEVKKSGNKKIRIVDGDAHVQKESGSRVKRQWAVPYYGYGASLYSPFTYSYGSYGYMPTYGGFYYGGGLPIRGANFIGNNFVNPSALGPNFQGNYFYGNNYLGNNNFGHHYHGSIYTGQNYLGNNYLGYGKK